MENLQNQTPESGNTPKRNQYISADEQITRMKVAFNNAQEPEIQSHLETVGITKGKLEAYRHYRAAELPGGNFYPERIPEKRTGQSPQSHQNPR